MLHNLSQCKKMGCRNIGICTNGRKVKDIAILEKNWEAFIKYKN